MTLTNFDGGWTGRIGYNTDISSVGPIAATGFQIDAADEAVIMIGHIVTSDGGSHTINTTGSSSLNWRSGVVTFASGSTTVKVGLAAVDTAAGPPGRAANTTNVINFDVSKTMVGSGSPAIVTNTWHTHVPDAGTKTIANGDLVAFAIQMTARGGSDLVIVAPQSAVNNVNFPHITTYIGAVYTLNAALPNCMIVFNDGARGWFFGSEVYSTLTTTTMNSGAATKEWGQLFKMPFPMRIYGLYGIATVGAAADFDMVLYSDPLGTPVAQRTVAVDANTIVSASQRRVNVLFPTPYDTTADQLIGAVYKPGSTNVFAYRKTLGAAADRITDVWGVDGYAISRATGAFADLNAGLDHFYIGLFVGGFGNDAGGGGGGVATPLFGGGVI